MLQEHNGHWKHRTGCKYLLLLLLLLSRFSRVRLCATPWTAAHQAPQSLGFSRQEHWSGLPFPSPMHGSEKWKWSCSVMSNLATPWTAAHQAPLSMGFFQARVLEWGAIAFSKISPGCSQILLWSSEQYYKNEGPTQLPFSQSWFGVKQKTRKNNLAVLSNPETTLYSFGLFTYAAAV